MTCTNKGIVLRIIIYSIALAAILCISVFDPAVAEPLLLVYPSSPAVFRYDPACYEVLSPADPNYDPAYDIGGKMLWDRVEQRVPIEIYRAPDLHGFRVSPFGLNEFVTMTNQFHMIVDGFFVAPRQLNELYLKVLPYPNHTSVLVTVAGDTMDRLITRIPGFYVSTQIEHGYFSDTQQLYVTWSGGVGMRLTVYGDKNGDLVYDNGLPRFSIYVMDATIPVKNMTWGGIKTLYGSE